MAGEPGQFGKGKVLLAMSGGVDSSVAAGLLRRDGYEVVGVFMRLGSPGEALDEPVADACDAPGTRVGHQGCCSVGDAGDARQVAASLGVPFYVCNFKKDFARIIDYFVDEYAMGRTPNPCVRCNDWLKFGKLHAYAAQLGCAFVASGHYARVGAGPDGSPRLRRGLDHAKDQSYVLFGIPREHLERTLFPVGGLEKARVRELAQEMGLPVFDKPDSQEICFVPDNDYAGLVERHRPGLARPGPVRDTSGAVLGTHGGQHRFTVGQRRGVALALGRPVYVVAKDPGDNSVTVGGRDELLVGSCVAAEVNWLAPGAVPTGWTACLARYRAHGEPVPARFRALDDADGPTPSGRAGRLEVCFERPQPAVAPGQAIVLDDAGHPDLVLGGGWIASVGRAGPA